MPIVYATQTDIILGVIVLDKTLFTAYTYAPPAPHEDEDEDEEDAESPAFQISLSSLLETLQIFGINDVKDRWSNRETGHNGMNGFSARGGPAGVFENRVLGMNGICRLSYAAIG